MTAPAGAPMPTRRIVRERRAGALRLGWVAVAIAVVATIATFLLIDAAQALEVATAEGRARVGNPISFDAEAGTRYVVVLTPDPGASAFREDRISELDCTSTGEDGEVDELNTRSATVRTTTSIGTVAAEFEPPAGATEVTCEWGLRGSLGGSYSVAEQREKTRIVGYALGALGIVAGIVGAAALWVGYRGKQVIRPIEPGPTPPPTT